MDHIRHTTQRQAVLRAVKFSPQPVSAEEILEHIERPRVAQATVYRNLEWLTRRGEIYRFTDDGGVTRYIGHAMRWAEFHCQRCGQAQTMTVPTDSIETAIGQYGRTGCLRIDVVGICQACQEKTE